MRKHAHIGAWLAVWAALCFAGGTCAAVLTGCGPAQEAEGYARELLSPGLTVAWSVNEERTEVTCANRDDVRSVEVWSAGAFCAWDCGYYRGAWLRVIVDADVRDGRFIPADEMVVYTGECWAEVACDTCDF